MKGNNGNISISFPCFLPEFEYIASREEGGEGFYKGFIQVEGFSFSVMDFSGVVNDASLCAGFPCTLKGKLKKNDYKGKSYNQIIVEQIIPYGQMLLNNKGGEK